MIGSQPEKSSNKYFASDAPDASLFYHTAAAGARLKNVVGATHDRVVAEVTVIFAELDYECSYDEAHEGLAAILRENFSAVESGHQGDSWFWVHDGAVKVAIDTFASMKHQVKSEASGPHVQRVLDVLGRHYRLSMKKPPEPEGHE